MPELEANSANKFFDYLAAGKPVVINYGGWQQALLEETGAGIRIKYQDLDRAAKSWSGSSKSRSARASIPGVGCTRSGPILPG